MTNEPHRTGAGVLTPPCAIDRGVNCYDEAQDQRCSACSMSHEHAALLAWQKLAASHFVRLTVREREVMEAILAGHLNKNIAADLGISQRTVENHRASIMRKTGSRSLPALSRLELAATWSSTEPRLVENCTP